MPSLPKPVQELERYARSFSHLEWAPLLALLLAAALTWGFIELADEVGEGSTASIDERILLSMRNPADSSDPLGPEIVEEIGRDLTALGGIAVLGLLTASTVLFLFLMPMPRAAIYVTIATAGAIAMSLGLKAAFARDRPDLVSHGSHAFTSSFPSGHSMMAAAVYLTLGMLLARQLARRRLQILVVSLAALLTIGVGVSRVYLGVHWPTDVLAGWAVGAAWALVCWYVAGWLQVRGQIEHEADVQKRSTSNVV
ncbi:phosphatase PAP2 family protein [Adhaeretor mobilis]|uniref:Undecaprenyl-diphosphatase YbjG n=1 Tax=Adhaeretor mobilis TaxID=1930276 RepID=A0A517N275_9BACT|nr:phosphatase PAP2 family protein [Adhaeretor mobilis]QDT01237.1 Putative undecaprenyl-diphosphatase YbjG [Adhaeretor mobilis]